MKVSSLLLGAMFTAAAFGAQAQGARDAVAVDPTHHHVILENDRVRVFEVIADPGARSPMHTHEPLVLISMSKARSRMTMPNGETAIFDLNPGQVLWLEDAEHSWELLAGRVHVIAVEIKEK
jgi:quercetin dioxygenase-like cupin family protein